MVKRKRQRVSKKFIPQASIVSDEIYLPNHSGEHTAGTTGTPINDRDIANKKYVDTQDALYLPLTGGTLSGVLYCDGAPVGLDVLYSAEIGTHLTVGNNLTVGNTSHFDQYIDIHQTSTASHYIQRWTYGTGASHHAFIQLYPDDGVHLSLLPAANRNFIIGGTMWNKDFDHTPASTNPTLFIHSEHDPDDDNTQWISFSHNQTNGVIKTGKGDIVLTPASERVKVNGAVSSATATITASSDTTDVSGINTLFINITGDIVLGGLIGGVNGQTINIVMLGNFVNHCTIEHAEGIGGSQDFINHTALDENISHGGSIYVCNGTNWYDTSHAKHV